MPLEELTGLEKTQEEPVVEEPAGADYESAPAEQPKKKRIKSKANRDFHPRAAPKKKKVAVGPEAAKKAKAPLMGRYRKAVTAELRLPIDFLIPALMEHSIIALGF